MAADDLREAIERLLDWGVGRSTNGIDRMIPASELRALLDAHPTPSEPLEPTFDRIGGAECPVCLRLGKRCHPDGGLIECAEGCDRCDRAVERRAKALGPIEWTEEGVRRIAADLATPSEPEATVVEEHVGCQEAYEKQRRRAQFAEARLSALVVEIRALGFRMDGISGHTSQPALGGKTLGGAVRALVADR